MEATDKMIEYAKAIAKKLDIEEPDFSNFENTSFFLSCFAPRYKAEMISYSSAFPAYKEWNFSENFLYYLSTKMGLYGLFFFWENDKIVYVGKSKNLGKQTYASLLVKLEQTSITHVSCLTTDIEADMHIMEAIVVTEIKPKLNTNYNCLDCSTSFKFPLPYNALHKVALFDNNKQGD